MIYIVLSIILIFCIALLLYMIKEAFEHNVLHHVIELKGVCEEQFKLFFISDIHNRIIREEEIRDKKGKFDGVIIGGDLADKRTPIERLIKNIQFLSTLGPVYFIWGNNDREVGEERLRNILSEWNVIMIENDAILLPNRKNKIWLNAIDDTTTKNVHFDKAFAKTEAKDVVLFVSHNPQVFSQVLVQYKVDFLMGGHLHGGQIRLGPFGIYPHGSFSYKKGIPVLISNGYGTTLLPLRLGAKPQCHIIDVKITM